MASQPIMDDMPTPHESAASPTSHLSQPPQESPPEMELEENIQSSQNADTNATMQRDAKQDLMSTKNISSPQPDEVGVEPDKSVQEPATKKQSAETYAEEVESDGEEAPLDLAKMSKFEYAQVAKLNPAQVRRYEQYRRSDLKNLKVKKVLTSYNPSLAKTSEQYIIAVKGLAKLFVGDVVELALEIKQKRGDKGALQPVHIREAYRRLRRDGFVPSTNDATPMFW